MQQPDPKELEGAYSSYEADALADGQPREHPVAIITGGQPGSGKSGLSSAAKDELQDRGGVLLVDADILRERHPLYQDLLELDDKKAANQTHEVASAWTRRLVNKGVAERRNLVIDQTSKNPDRMDELTKRLRREGYRVELRVMAASPLVSEQRIRLRYEEEKVKHGFGRFTPQKVHKEALDGISQTLEYVDRHKSVDRVAIYGIHGNPIYDNLLVDGKWEKQPESRQVLEKERERALTPTERQEFSQGYDKIFRLMNSRHADRREIAEVQASRAAAEKQLEKQQEAQHLGKTYEGAIVGIEGNTVYQKTEGGIVAHARHELSGKSLNLESLKESGQSVTIRYGAYARIGLVKEGRAVQDQKLELGKASKGKTLGKF